MVISFIFPILQTVSDRGRGCFVQAYRTNESRIRLAYFPDLHSCAVISGLCSICTAQLFRLCSFHGPPWRRWSIWRGCRPLEEVLCCRISPSSWLAVQMTHPRRLSRCLVEPACSSSQSPNWRLFSACLWRFWSDVGLFSRYVLGKTHLF